MINNTYNSKIYLISPPKINTNIFFKSLKIALQTNQVSVFQLRIKDYSISQIIEIAKETKKICRDYQVEFVLNDYVEIIEFIEPDVIHVGLDNYNNFQLLDQIKKNNTKLKCSASCYNSEKLAMIALENNFDFLSFGPFFPSKTKPTNRSSPDLKMICKLAKNYNFKSIAIGGIDNQNCKILIENKINYLAVISYVFDHPDGVDKAINNLSEAIKKFSS